MLNGGGGGGGGRLCGDKIARSEATSEENNLETAQSETTSDRNNHLNTITNTLEGLGE